MTANTVAELPVLSELDKQFVALETQQQQIQAQKKLIEEYKNAKKLG